MFSASLKNKIRDSYANNKNIELEAKFGSFSKGKFDSSLQRQTFNRVKAYFDKMATSSNSKTTDYIMGRIRKSVDENNVTSWLSKERLLNEDIRDYNLRISISRELESPPILNHFDPEIIREKSRSSYFVFNGTVRIDLTLVDTTFLGKSAEIFQEGGTSYEAEVELLDPKFLDNFEKAVNVTLRLVLDTVILYTEKERISVTNEINSILGSNKKGYIDNYPLVQARNLKKRDMVFGGLVGNQKTGYSATIKSDGIRKMLYFSKIGIWLASTTSLSKVSNTDISNLNGTILDGELIPVENRLENAPKSKFWFLAFDTLAWISDKSVQNANHNTRMQYAQTVADQVKGDILMINTKSFFNFDTPAEFFNVMRDLFRSFPLLPYKQDGIIFTPQNEIYNPHTDKLPLYKRKLTDYPDICKWKPSFLLTIDLLIKWRADITSPIGRILELYSIDKNELIPFTIFKNIDFENPLTLNLPSNTIVEYGYDYERKILIPHRIRFDKEKPNRRDVADDVAEDILDPIDEETMKGNTFTLLRRYHNSIKRDLFIQSLKETQNYNTKKTLLDIGSGYGGDLGKWKGFDRIVAVEPDPEHVEELKKRIITYNMQDKVRIVLAGGQETEKITKETREWLNGRADIVSSMLSLTFFWQNSDLVNSLVNTIISNIKEGGKYIFLTMDGDLVEQTFEPAFGTGQVLKQLDLGPATLRYNSDTNPKELYIDIKGTIVEKQREWLVRLDDLRLRLEKYGFKLISIEKADKKKFLNEFETMMTKMYTYGIFSHNGENALPEINKETTTSLSLIGATPIDLPRKEEIIDEIVEEELDVLDPDQVEFVNVTWWNENEVVRIGSLNNENSLFHAILNAYLRIYQINPSIEFRERFVRDLKIDIALRATNLSEKIQETISDEVYLLISELLGVDLYIMRITNKDLYSYFNTRKEGINKRSIVIAGDDLYFETIGLIRDKLYQTFFEPTDSFILKIQSLS